MKSKSVISGFIAKLPLFRADLWSRFPIFQGWMKWTPIFITTHCWYFWNHITNSEADMKERFTDLLNLEIHTSILDPFEISKNKVQWSCGLGADLIDLGHDFELKPIFNKQQYQEFWLQQAVTDKYSSLCKGTKAFLYFTTSYFVESGFYNVVSQFLTKARNRLNIVEIGDLCLHLTAITPNIEQLMSQHQVQPSHWLWVSHHHHE